MQKTKLKPASFKTVALDTACRLARKAGKSWSDVAKCIITESLPLGGTAFRVPASVVNGWQQAAK